MGLTGSTTSFSILHIKMSEKTKNTGVPTGHPSSCFIKQEFTKKGAFFR